MKIPQYLEVFGAYMQRVADEVMSRRTLTEDRASRMCERLRGEIGDRVGPR